MPVSKHRKHDKFAIGLVEVAHNFQPSVGDETLYVPLILFISKTWQSVWEKVLVRLLLNYFISYINDISDNAVSHFLYLGNQQKKNPITKETRA